MQGAVAGIQGGDDDQGVEGQHHKGVDEHTGHGHHALIVGVGHIGLGVGVGSGAHTGFIGEQAALGALADGGFQGIADAAADDGAGVKGILEDHAEGLGNVPDADCQNHQRTQQEDSGHNGHQLFGDGSQTLHAAQEDNGADDDQHDTHDPGRDTESSLEGGADGVGLHHAAHETQGQDDGNGEEPGQELAEAALKSGGDVVHRAAVNGAVLVNDTGLLGQGGFRVDSSHAEEGNDPHPEDGAGAAGEDGAGGADDVAGTHLSGNGGGQGLEGGHAALLSAALEPDVAKGLFHGLAEAADLHEAGANGVPQAHADEQEHQDVAR